jgi:hypothetical protein
MNSEKPLDPEAAAAIARVRKLMLIASATTLIGVGAVLAVIGYRVFHWQGSAQPAAALTEQDAGLPPDSKILSSAVGDGRLVLTIEIGGVIELRSFDLATLQPIARMRLTPARP